MMREAKKYLADQGLSYDLNLKMKELSLADAQMIEIIKAVSCDAKIILMDEPTSSLTEKEVNYLIEKIFELKKQGIAVMFVSSEMPEVMGIADRIIVMCDGRITGEDMARKTTQNEILTLATTFEDKKINSRSGKEEV